MAFNIWERWPWTSFQNLNLDWLMKAVKEAVTKADEAAASVGQFDARITQNTNAIEQLGIDLETISSPVRVFVSAELEARYRGQLVTGEQLLTMMQTHGDLPYVEYNGEIYMLDTAQSTGDLRFSMAHTTLLGDVILRHITIPAQSSNVAYSVTNVGGGGSDSSNVMVVTITDSGSGYTMDSTYAAITSQLDAGKAVVVRVDSTGSTGAYAASGMIMKETAVVDGQTIGVLRIIDPNMIRPAGAFNMYAWYIYENNTVGHGIIHENIATQAAVSAWVDDGDTNALLKTAQTLTTAEQEQVKQNLGISGTGGGTVPRVPISATSSVIPPLSPNTLYVFTGDATALNIQLASPSDSNIANEYHFIFNSGATPTTLTLPSTINQPDGFTVEANHVYEVSILEGNMTAQGWAVSA